MKMAMWIVGVLFLIFAPLAFWAYRAADRPGDDFGAGVIAWFLILLAGLFGIAWLILAAIHGFSS